MAKRKPRLAVWKFTSCDGCQLTVLDCEDELLEIAERFDIVHFLEAGRRAGRGRFDISIVEGSITTAPEVKAIRTIRARSKVLVGIGACATAGGIQALRNFRHIQGFLDLVYARPDTIDTLAQSTAISAHVPVDFELRGCPPSRQQLLDVLSAYLHGRNPVVPRHSQCMECKMQGTVCLMVAEGVPCMGPVTQAGCGNLCPSHGRGCYGCWGPMETPDTAALSAWFRRLGCSERDIARMFHTYNAAAEPFRAEGSRHG